MTRKDYERLATALARSKTHATTERELELWWEIYDAISNELADDNPRFDRQRFYEACRYAPK